MGGIYVVYDWIDLASEYRSKNKPPHPLVLRESFLKHSTVRIDRECWLDGHRFVAIDAWRSVRCSDGKERIGVEAKFYEWSIVRLRENYTKVFGAPEQDNLFGGES